MSRSRRSLISALLSFVVAGSCPAQAPDFPSASLARIDDAIFQAITDAKTPGAVFRIEHGGHVYEQAYGSRALVPRREVMTENTIFDAASLTKSVVTTTAILILNDREKIDLESPVATYLPTFSGAGREAITIRQLLTHSSGLRGGMTLQNPGKTGALEAAAAEKLQSDPGTAYRYSDINFILLGLVVEQVSGIGLDEFWNNEVAVPLGLLDSGYGPVTGAKLERVAPTTLMKNGDPLRGIVHDPTARRMGGVAGHAGLFTTTADLGRFSQMLLGDGELDGVRILKPETVKAMTSVQSPPGLPRRGFGWDIDSPYAGPRGALFPIGSYGHTGWTGTGLWIDPFSKTTTIFLSNRNHPDENGSVIELQRELGTRSAAAIPDFDFTAVVDALPYDKNGATLRPRQVVTTGPTQNGIDVLERSNFRQLRGRKIGLITNQTGITNQGKSTIDALRAAPGLELVALFSPEHGIRGNTEASEIADSTDSESGLPIFSLYGKSRVPSAAQLKGIDTLVFDIQDIGCRFYTYISTMDHCMEAAAEHGVDFIVLDRVNPIGELVEGPVLSGERSFVGTFPLPLRHGMTVGEIARMISGERGYRIRPGIIRCEGASPLRWFDQSGLPWQNPSPNIRNLDSAILYPGVGMIEFCRISVGRGTTSPFEVVGAPYLDGAALAAKLNAANLPGVEFEAAKFTPDTSRFVGEECGGVRIRLTDCETFRAADLGIVLASAIHQMNPEEFNVGQMKLLLGDEESLQAIRVGKDFEEIKLIRDRALGKFMTDREPYLLYSRAR